MFQNYWPKRLSSFSSNYPTMEGILLQGTESPSQGVCRGIKELWTGKWDKCPASLVWTPTATLGSCCPIASAVKGSSHFLTWNLARFPITLSKTWAVLHSLQGPECQVPSPPPSPYLPPVSPHWPLSTCRTLSHARLLHMRFPLPDVPFSSLFSWLFLSSSSACLLPLLCDLPWLPHRKQDFCNIISQPLVCFLHRHHHHQFYLYLLVWLFSSILPTRALAPTGRLAILMLRPNTWPSSW